MTDSDGSVYQTECRICEVCFFVKETTLLFIYSSMIVEQHERACALKTRPRFLSSRRNLTGQMVPRTQRQGQHLALSAASVDVESQSQHRQCLSRHAAALAP